MFSSAMPVLDGTFSDPSTQNIHTDYIIKRNFTCQGDERHLLLNCIYYTTEVQTTVMILTLRWSLLESTALVKSINGQSLVIGWYTFAHDSICHAEETRCDNNEIRLNNHTTLNNASGRVEVCLGGLWGIVCDNGWTRNDANAVCRQLGYNYGM